MANRDERRSRTAEFPAPPAAAETTFHFHQFPTTSPLVLAGRHLVFLRAEKLESIAADRLRLGYIQGRHAEYCVFSVPVGGSERTILTYAPPYVYITAPGQLQRVHVRGDSAHPALEVLASDARIEPSGAPASVLLPGETQIAFPMGRRFALLALDQRHRPRTDGAEPLWWAPFTAGSHWHAPVYADGRWYFVDEGGTLAVMEQQQAPPFWGSAREPFRLADADERAVIPMGGAGEQLSAPVLVGRHLFIAFRSGPVAGVYRVCTDDLRVQRLRYDGLDFDGDAPFLPLGERGVLAGAGNGESAFFAPVSGQGSEIGLVGADESRFRLRHALQLTSGGLALVPGGAPGVSRVVVLQPDMGNRRLLCRSLTELDTPWEEVQSLTALPVAQGEPATVIVQARQKVFLFYPTVQP